MTHALTMHAGPAHAHVFRALVTAVFCAGAIALLCAAAVVNGPAAPPVSATGVPEATLAAPAAAVDSGTQLDNDIAVRPKVDGVTTHHALRKPRRANRRLRVPGSGKAHSGSTRAGTRGISTTQLQLKRKRMSKRAQMRRLLTVRGGLQA